MDFGDLEQRALFFDLHNGLPREGPGDRAAVGRALRLAQPLPPRPRVLDLACGPGGQTIDLALLLPDAEIAALDAHAPFLRDLEKRAAERGLSERIRTFHGDMAEPPFGEASFDLVWCEGAAYILGLERALALWKPLLVPGGVLAVTEPVWFEPEPPPPLAAAFAEYAAMGFPDDARAVARRCGFGVAGDFVLDEAAWWTSYYKPLKQRLRDFEARHAGNAAAKLVADDARAEMELRAQHAEYYGYLFLVLRS